MEVAGPGAGLAKQGTTIANGHGGNSTGHESPDRTLIGSFVFEKALRTDTHQALFLAFLQGKILKDQLPSASIFLIFFPSSSTPV